MNAKRTVFHILGFILCVCLVLGYLNAVFLPKSRGDLDYLPKTNSFYDQPKNTIDVLFLGDSIFRNGISPLILWQTAGITGYVRATSRQDPMVSYYYLLESLKYQTPKVVVLESHTLFWPYDHDRIGNESHYREALDTIRLSWVKLQLITNVVNGSSIHTASSYLFPLLRYHSRWKEMGMLDLMDIDLHPHDPYRGHWVVLKREAFTMPNSYMTPSSELADFNKESLIYHEKIIQLCKQKGIDLVYVSFPMIADSSYARSNAARQFAKKNGSLYIDYSVPEVYSRVGFDPGADLADINHCNSYGATKFSIDLARVIDESFNLPDRRNEPGLQQWDIDLNTLLEQLTQDE